MNLSACVQRVADTVTSRLFPWDAAPRVGLTRRQGGLQSMDESVIAEYPRRSVRTSTNLRAGRRQPLEAILASRPGCADPAARRSDLFR